MSCLEVIQEQQVQARELQLSNELSRPDISSFSQNFDSAFGNPGAFRQEVIRQGQLAWHNEKIDLPVDQAVKRVMDQYGSMVTPPSPVQSQPAAPHVHNQQPKVVVSQQPTLPNMQAGGGSPAKRQISSLDELKKIRQSMA